MLKHLMILLLLLPVPATASVGISGLEALPDPFSPNGDGTRDSTVVSFTLETDQPAAFVWITVTDSEGGVVIRLADAEPDSPGEIRKVWLGQTSTGNPAPDGIYTFQVKAKAGTDSTPVSARSVFLDTTAPLIGNVRPHPSPYAPEAPNADSLLTVDISISGSDQGDWLTAVMKIPDEPLTLCELTLSGTDSTYTCTWDGREYADGIYTLEVTTFDPAGNSASSSRSVDLDLKGPDLFIDYPNVAVMDTFPDVVSGTYYDRNGVDSIGFRFHGNMSYVAVTVPEPVPCCPIPWAVAWPDSLRHDGIYILEIHAVDAPGYETDFKRQMEIKTEASDAPTLSGLPEKVSEPDLSITGTCGSGDTLFLYLNGAAEKQVLCSGSGTFSTTVTLDLGLNEIYAVSKDIVGHYSDPSETVTVEYVEQPGIRVDERLAGPTTIEVNLPADAGQVILRIFALSGSYIRTIVEDNPGQFGEVFWDLTDEDGKPVKNGPYILAFEIRYASGATSVEKVAVVVVR